MDEIVKLLEKFPVRKSSRQKEKFRAAVLSYGEQLGYTVTVEQGHFGVKNIVFGEQETAKYVVTAHYDTCATLPVPNFITPCNFGIYLLWQLFLFLLMCVPIVAVSVLIGGVLELRGLAVFAAYFVLFSEIILMIMGPANRSNVNDNTSGVVTVLHTAAAMPQELRSQVCFVLFDLEEAGLFGSAAYRKQHKDATNRQVILNLDCVGEGDELLVMPSPKLKRHREYMKKLRAGCGKFDGKSISLREKGFTFYPSDQANFPLSVGLAAFCRVRGIGLYLGKIHTARDRVLDKGNVDLFRNYILNVISGQE